MARQKKDKKTDKKADKKADEPHAKGGAQTKTGAVTNFAPPKYDPQERNVKVGSVDINYFGANVLVDADINLVQGRRYGMHCSSRHFPFYFNF